MYNCPFYFVFTGETTHDCNTMQSCRNTKGGYDCPCIEGYTRNNETGECDGKRDGGGLRYEHTVLCPVCPKW